MSIITLYKNTTHAVAFNHVSDHYEVFLRSAPDAVVRSFPYAESRGFERAVACAMHEEYTIAKENAR
ncbi:hypothetical protein NP1_62 [Xanthomonas phage NP1]|nr:hypothetical protein NP1_62 [Xanthomonas phage NP1]